MAATNGHYKTEYVLHGITLAIVLAYIILLLVGLNYVYFAEHGNKLIFRYYTAHPIFRKYKAIEIKNNQEILNVDVVEDQIVKLPEEEDLKKQLSSN